MLLNPINADHDLVNDQVENFPVIICGIVTTYFNRILLSGISDILWKTAIFFANLAVICQKKLKQAIRGNSRYFLPNISEIINDK